MIKTMHDITVENSFLVKNKLLLKKYVLILKTNLLKYNMFWS